MENQNNAIIYTCPMHPEVRRGTPGICPECGMNLVKAKNAKRKTQNTDNEKHAGHSTEMFLRKFLVSLILTIPVVIQDWFLPAFTGSKYISLVLGSIVFFYGGWVFLKGAGKEIQARLPGMMTLIGIAISAAYIWSLYAVFAGLTALFWELTTLITVMLLGHWLEMRAVSSAQKALKELAKLLPEEAFLLRDNTFVVVPINELKVGDIVLVKPGAKIPADGKVIEGSSEVNESIVTGESKLVPKKEGDEAIAGTTNGDGSLKIEITKIGEDTFLGRVRRLVAEAQASKSRLQILSDKAAFLLTVVAIGIGILTLSSWIVLGAALTFAVARLVAVLVIACPHALGLAVPLVASISTNMAASQGFIVKQRLALEAARNIDIVLFDKTGTLTKGEFGIDALVPYSGYKEEDLLLLGASINQYSEHAIAKAMVKEAENRGGVLFEVKDFQRIPGKGAKGIINGKEVLVGSEVLLGENGIRPESEFAQRAAILASEGKTVVFVVSDSKLAGLIALADIVREESREAIKALQRQGVKVAMVTGDSEDVASFVAKQLGIDEYFARVLPEEKSGKVKFLQRRKLKVAMVGDGVNDAPALTQADLGIAIGAGTNVAIESAGIILVRNDPRDIPKIIRLSRLTYSKMIQNLFWATGYNVIALPLAAGILASRGILLEPAVAAVFMSVSTVIVAINAMLLKKNKL